MELYLDTANVAEVNKRSACIFPIAWVTTNPSIIAASKGIHGVVSAASLQVIGDEGVSVCLDDES